MKDNQNHIKILKQPKSGMWNGDGWRVIFLIILYCVQGLGFGFMEISLPIVLKKKLNYTEIGVVSCAVWPFTVKFLFAPIVDSFYIKSLGKRRTWIVIPQILSCFAILFLVMDLNTLIIIENSIYTLTAMLWAIVVFLALQDIAIDGWWITILKEENLKYAATIQFIGVSIGIFLSSTIYFALSSIEFWNSYIFAISHELPILDEVSFFKWWCIYVLLVSIITLIFGNEKYDRITVNDSEQTFSKVIKSTIKFAQSKQVISVWLFIIVIDLFSYVNQFVGKIFLIDELKYSQSKYSLITLLSFPFSILASILVSKYSSKQYLSTYVFLMIIQCINDLFIVNIVYYFEFEGLKFERMVFLSWMISDAVENCFFTVITNYTNDIWNPQLASTQIAFLISMFNLSHIIPKLYTYRLVDMFGIYSVNIIFCMISLSLCAFLYPLVQTKSIYYRFKENKRKEL